MSRADAFSIEWTDAAGEQHNDSRATEAAALECLRQQADKGAVFAVVILIGDDPDGADDELIAQHFGAVH